MKVTIVGAGNMGRGIGTPAVARGHEVEIVDRDPRRPRSWQRSSRSSPRECRS